MSDFAARSLVFFYHGGQRGHFVDRATGDRPFQFFYYQAPMFLLLRYLSAWRISLFAIAIVLLLYLLEVVALGRLHEVGSGLLILLVLDLLATSGGQNSDC